MLCTGIVYDVCQDGTELIDHHIPCPFHHLDDDMDYRYKEPKLGATKRDYSPMYDDD